MVATRQIAGIRASCERIQKSAAAILQALSPWPTTRPLETLRSNSRRKGCYSVRRGGDSVGSGSRRNVFVTFCRHLQLTLSFSEWQDATPRLKVMSMGRSHYWRKNGHMLLAKLVAGWSRLTGTGGLQMPCGKTQQQ